MNHSKSKSLFDQAKNFIPGGVNSPVRAFKAVGGSPIFMKSAKGAYLTDEDDNQYIDLINSWGPMILGHANPMIEEAIKKAVEGSTSFGAPTRREVEMAELVIEMVPSIEKIRMVNSGTEATMSAIRVARGYTKREKIIKFEGCYHGHGDSFLIAAGSGAVTMGVPDSPGVTKGVANDTLTAPYNNLDAVKMVVEANKNQIAALILEPVVGNMGLVIPAIGFIEGLRKICDVEGIVLIFDEVMTGFRLSSLGYQGLTSVQPDLTTLGKIIGGGLPVGAYGGKKEIMDMVSPAGPVYQAGTLSGNPLAMAAGMAMLKHLKNNPEVYSKLEQTGQNLTEGLSKINAEFGKTFTINRVGSMFTMFMADFEINNFEDAKKADLGLFGRYFQAMLKRGVYLPPSQFESAFISTAINPAEIDLILEAHRGALEEVL